MHIIGVRWKAVSILHIWCMITESLSELVVSAFIRLCRPIIIRQVNAIHTLDLLVKDAKEQGVLQIALEATDMGRPLYERYGFVKMEDEMELI